MRRFLLGVLLLPALAFAQPVTVEKTIPCNSFNEVIENLTKQYGEQPIWIGQAKDSRVALLVNPQTNTWTVLQFNEKIGCALEVGEGFQLRPGLFGGKGI